MSSRGTSTQWLVAGITTTVAGGSVAVAGAYSVVQEQAQAVAVSPETIVLTVVGVVVASFGAIVGLASWALKTLLKTTIQNLNSRLDRNEASIRQAWRNCPLVKDGHGVGPGPPKQTRSTESEEPGAEDRLARLEAEVEQVYRHLGKFTFPSPGRDDADEQKGA